MAHADDPLIRALCDLVEKWREEDADEAEGYARERYPQSCCTPEFIANVRQAAADTCARANELEASKLAALLRRVEAPIDVSILAVDVRLGLRQHRTECPSGLHPQRFDAVVAAVQRVCDGPAVRAGSPQPESDLAKILQEPE